MKYPAALIAALQKHLAATWHDNLTGTVGWPFKLSLGEVSNEALESDFLTVQRWALEVQAWAKDRGIEVVMKSRRLVRANEILPTHVCVQSADDAAQVLGEVWSHRLRRGRQRLGTLVQHFPDLEDATRVVRSVDGWPETDFDLLLAAAQWFRENPHSGLSARQVPVVGMQSKWLETHEATVLRVSGLSDLGLGRRRPLVVHFTYLDPEHRASGGRLHDSVALLTPMDPAYPPSVVLITENKDSAVFFPPLLGGVAVQGDGKAGPRAVSQVSWLMTCPKIIYWGDLDAPGFEIINMYRAAGVPVRTILMDVETLRGHERFSVDKDPKGRPLKRSPRRNLPHLTETERAAYEWITGDGPIRLEQERIPLSVAFAAVQSHL